MKSRILGKSIVMCLLVLGMVLMLGAKAMVSANPLYFRSAQNPVLMAQFLPWPPIYPIPPWPPTYLLAQPKLTSNPGVSEDLSGMVANGLTGINVFRHKNLKNDSVIEEYKSRKPMVLASFGLIPFF